MAEWSDLGEVMAARTQSDAATAHVSVARATAESTKDDAAAEIQGHAKGILLEKRATKEAAAETVAPAKEAAPKSATKEATAAKEPEVAKVATAKEATVKEAYPASESAAVGSVAPALPPPLPGGWRSAQTKEGKTYYYHTVTKQTTWSRPSGPAQSAPKISAPTPPKSPAPTPPKSPAPTQPQSLAPTPPPKVPIPGRQPDTTVKEDASLPAGWAELQTLGGHAYYYHSELRTTAWKRPTAEFHRQQEELAKEAAAAEAKAKAMAAPDDIATALGVWVHVLHTPMPSADMAVEEVAPLAAGWSELHTLGGATYYYHKESRTTAWTRPTAEGGPAKVVTTQAADGAAEPPLPAGWYALQTLGGRTYYYHKDQKTTAWKRPTASQNLALDA